MNDQRMLTISYSSIARGGTRIIEAGELCIPLGSTVGLVGLNGSGKSTLMTAIAGALTDRSATVAIRTPAGPVQSVGYVPQLPRLPDWLSAAETARLFGVPPEDLVHHFPEFQLNLLLGTRIPALSGGQRQLLIVALALRQRAELIMLDEPLSALDIRRRRQLLERLKERETGQQQVVRLISSQIAADIAEVCDWLIVLRDGRVVFQGARGSLVPSATASLNTRTVEQASDHFEERILKLLGE